MDLVSVIIITYKRPIEILKRAVSSVLNQSYHSIELIVVNDAPEEIKLKQRIEQCLADFKDDRITYICHKKNHLNAFLTRIYDIMDFRNEEKLWNHYNKNSIKNYQNLKRRQNYSVKKKSPSKNIKDTAEDLDPTPNVAEKLLCFACA